MRPCRMTFWSTLFRAPVFIALLIPWLTYYFKKVDGWKCNKCLTLLPEKLLTRLINCLNSWPVSFDWRIIKSTNRYDSLSGEPNMQMFSALCTHNTKCVCNQSCMQMIYSSMFCLRASVWKWRAFTLSGKPNLNSHFVFFSILSLFQPWWIRSSLPKNAHGHTGRRARWPRSPRLRL